RGRVEDDVKRLPLEKCAQRQKRRLVFEAGHEDAGNCEPLVAKRPGQRLYRREIVGEIDGAIEDDEGARCALARLKTGRIKAAKGANRDRRRSCRSATD